MPTPRKALDLDDRPSKDIVDFFHLDNRNIAIANRRTDAQVQNQTGTLLGEDCSL